MVRAFSEWFSCYCLLGIFNSKVLEGEFIVNVWGWQDVELWIGHEEEFLGAGVAVHFLCRFAGCEHHHRQ
jgi:hypothetical protein